MSEFLSALTSCFTVTDSAQLVFVFHCEFTVNDLAGRKVMPVMIKILLTLT